jgi:hypothetical protein
MDEEFSSGSVILLPFYLSALHCLPPPHDLDTILQVAVYVLPGLTLSSTCLSVAIFPLRLVTVQPLVLRHPFHDHRPCDILTFPPKEAAI